MRMRSSWVVLVALLVSSLAVAAACQRQSAAVAPAVPPATVAAAAATPAAAGGSSGKIQLRVTVQVTEEGFVPSSIPAQVGKPITLAITRKTDRTCAREILFKGQDGKTDLPLDKEVEVTYTPKVAGPVAFGCAMGMMIGGSLQVR